RPPGAMWGTTARPGRWCGSETCRAHTGVGGGGNMGKGGGGTTISAMPDQATQDYVRRMRQLAMGYAGGNVPLPPEAQQAMQQAGFNYDAFNQAMQRAMGTANLGFGALGARAFLPQQYAAGNIGLLGAGMGPYGQTTTQKMYTDPWSQILGTGVTLASLLG